MGDFNQQYILEKRALKIYEQLLGTEAAETIATYNRLTDLAIYLCRPLEAKYYIKKYSQSQT